LGEKGYQKSESIVEKGRIGFFKIKVCGKNVCPVDNEIMKRG